MKKIEQQLYVVHAQNKNSGIPTPQKSITTTPAITTIEDKTRTIDISKEEGETPKLFKFYKKYISVIKYHYIGI